MHRVKRFDIQAAVDVLARYELDLDMESIPALAERHGLTLG
jgi:hypothetical protein